MFSTVKKFVKSEPLEQQQMLLELHGFIWKTYGRQVWVGLLVYILSGWGLRQIGHLHPTLASWLYGDRVPDPPLLESLMWWVVFTVLRFGLHVFSGIVALALASFVLFAWNVWSKTISQENFRRTYGEGSWAAVLMAPEDPLGLSFCLELARENFNLLVICESGMREVCATLQKTSGVQVQPFEIPLHDAEKITKAWSKFDVSLVVFVAPRDATKSAGEERSGLATTLSFVGQGAKIAEQVFAAASAKLLDGKLSSSQPSTGKRRGLICTTSLCGMFPVPGRAVQCASDAAALALATSLATELRPHGVDVVCAPCTDLFAVEVKNDVDMRATARTVLIALARGQKLCFGIFRQAAKAWALDATPACLRQWLFDQIWGRLCKMKEDRGKKEAEAEASKAGSSSDTYTPANKSDSQVATESEEKAAT